MEKTDGIKMNWAKIYLEKTAQESSAPEELLTSVTNRYREEANFARKHPLYRPTRDGLALGTIGAALGALNRGSGSAAARAAIVGGFSAAAGAAHGAITDALARVVSPPGHVRAEYAAKHANAFSEAWEDKGALNDNMRKERAELSRRHPLVRPITTALAHGASVAPNGPLAALSVAIGAGTYSAAGDALARYLSPVGAKYRLNNEPATR